LRHIEQILTQSAAGENFDSNHDSTLQEKSRTYFATMWIEADSSGADSGIISPLAHHDLTFLRQNCHRPLLSSYVRNSPSCLGRSGLFFAQTLHRQ